MPCVFTEIALNNRYFTFCPISAPTYTYHTYLYFIKVIINIILFFILLKHWFIEVGRSRCR